MSRFTGEAMDADGYPTQEFLEWIDDYNILFNGIHALVDAIEPNWRYGDKYFVKKKPRNGYFKLELHTGGWSGNEEILSALRSKFMWNYFATEWKAGGHYYYKFPTKDIL